MKGIRFFSGLFLLLLSAAGAAYGETTREDARVEVEEWNQGVEYFQTGDATNALRVLKPLMLSKRYGARAAELVASLTYDKVHDPATAADPAALASAREELAASAQIALRAHSDDARANRNFTRAIDGLATARETRRIESALKAAEGKDPETMLKSAVETARQALVRAAAQATNAPARQVAEADALSDKVGRLADVWLGVKASIAEAVTNAEEAATISARVDEARTKTLSAAEKLADLDASAYGLVAEIETDLTAFYKSVVMPPSAIRDDERAQTNAYLAVENVNERPWQQEALSFTRAFRARFPAWARAYETQAQSDTNRPPFTAEAQAKISSLATELEKLQLALCEKELPPQQEQALEIIREIIELLPNNPNDQQGSQGSPQASQDPNKSDDSKSDQSENNENENGESDTPEAGENEAPNDESGADEEKESEKSEAANEEKEPTEEEKAIEALLKKAQERSDEHEAEKRERVRKAALPPNERDW